MIKWRVRNVCNVAHRTIASVSASATALPIHCLTLQCLYKASTTRSACRAQYQYRVHNPLQAHQRQAYLACRITSHSKKISHTVHQQSHDGLQQLMHCRRALILTHSYQFWPSTLLLHAQPS